MNYIKEIKLFNNDDTKTVNMVIEIVKGSKNKNELVPKTFDRIERVRKCKLKYPFYYGCFPQTLAGDNDPADAILITKKKHKLLDIVKVKPIAVIKTIDNGEEDNKIICIEGTLNNLEKRLKRALKFLKIYKGKKADMIVDDKIYDEIEALEALMVAYKSNNKGKENSLKIN